MLNFLGVVPNSHCFPSLNMHNKVIRCVGARSKCSVHTCSIHGKLVSLNCVTTVEPLTQLLMLEVQFCCIL